MRVIVNFIWLFLFLLVGGQHLHAETPSIGISDSPSWDFIKKQQVKLKTSDSGNVLIENAEVELDEEFRSSDDLNKDNVNRILVEKNSLLGDWYSTFSNTFIYKDYSKQFENFAPNCAYSNPIYLRIGVLRI